MIITAYKTPKIRVGAELFSTLDASLPSLQECDIVVVTSKVISICQGRVIKNDGTIDKQELIRKEAELYIEEPKLLAQGVTLSINHSMLIANAGIDESNGDGFFILWPHDVDAAAADIWNHLKEKYSLRQLGVIVTDSRLTPLRWGTTGVGLAWCGFEPLKNYIGAPDIFGKKLRHTKASVLDGLAAASVAVMGEGDEQTPVAVIRDASFVQFQDRIPTKEEITALKIALEEDIYAPLLTKTNWEIGAMG